MKQFNKPFGYLVIFNVTNKDLSFGTQTDFYNIHFVSLGNKTISLITIDIYEHAEPVSQRNLMEAVEIKYEDLIRFVDENK